MTRRRLLVLAWLVGVPMALGAVVGFGGALGWIPDLFAHFRLQYAVLLAVATGLALAGGGRRSAAALGIVLALDVAVLAPLWIPPGQGDPGPDRLRVGSVNVLSSNRDAVAVLEWLDSSGADLVLAMEVDEWWQRRLSTSSSYELVFAQPRFDNFGMALLARRGGRAELRSVTTPAAFASIIDVPVVEARVSFGGCELRLLGLHTLPPVGPRYAAWRDGQIATAAEWARGELPAVIVGDLNATRWSHPFRRMLREARLVDSARGFGWKATWPAFPGPIAALRVPIDQAVHSSELVTTARVVGAPVGSDHLPLLLELAWRDGACGSPERARSGVPQ